MRLGLRSAQFLPWLVLAASLAVTYQLWENARNEAARVLQTDFNFRVLDAASRIEQRILAYSQVLRGAQGLFAASRSVERDEFRAYIAMPYLEEKFPGIQGVGFALAVPAAQKDKHIATLRKEGFPEYTIRPEGQRDSYSPVIYLEPFSGRNLRAFGYDMYSEPARRAAMERARDLNAPANSGKITLVQETNQDAQAGFLMYLPVYKNGVPHDTLTERRSNILGWVHAPFRMDDLMAGILGEHSAEIDIEIYDDMEISSETLMHDADKIRHDIDKSSSRFQSIKHIEIAGHTWTMLIRSLPGLELRLDKTTPQLIATAGIGTGLLLTLLIWLLVYGRARAMQASLELERRVAERTAELAAKNRELETFTYSVSHDLKAPLRGIDGYSRLLLSDYAERLDEEGRHFVQTIRKATEQMDQLINDLLAYSRIERRGMMLTQVDPRQLAETLVAERAEEIRTRGVQVTVNIACEHVNAEAEGLALALRNLLDNALKFTCQVAEPRVDIGGGVQDGKCVLWVRDNGPGFDMQYRERIFEIFQRLHRAEEFPGTGIGLAIVRKSMQRMHGRAWAQSEPGEGATFFLEVPTNGEIT